MSKESVVTLGGLLGDQMRHKTVVIALGSLVLNKPVNPEPAYYFRDIPDKSFVKVLKG